MILFLHGRGECGTDGLKHVRNSSIAQAVMAQPGRWPFVIVMPQKPEADEQWEDLDAVVMAALDQAVREHNADPGRVYLTGLSQGGHGAWVLAGLHPDRFAAVAPICGYLNADFRSSPPDTPHVRDLAARLDAMPVWCFHGESDDIVPLSHSRIIVDALLARGGARRAEAKLTTYPGTGHNSWDKAFAEPDLPGWFLNHRRSSRQP